MARPRGTGKRGEETKARILATAETLFGERGFVETRLEDVAEGVGVRRSALVYYFADKQELYRAVLEEVFGGLVDCVVEASRVEAGPAEGLEAMARAWAAYASDRPASARLYLREIANSAPGRTPAIAEYSRAIYERAAELTREGERAGVFPRVNTLRLVGMISGATLILAAGVPTLGIEPSYNPLSPRERKAHSDDIARMTRGLLGLGDANGAEPRGKKKGSSRKRK